VSDILYLLDVMQKRPVWR